MKRIALFVLLVLVCATLLSGLSYADNGCDHVYNVNHICAKCGEKYNNGEKIEGGYEYTTHVFSGYFPEDQCIVCNTKIQLGGNLFSISSWHDYSPGDSEVSEYPGNTVYAAIENGILDSKRMELYESEIGELSYYTYIPQSQEWHDYMCEKNHTVYGPGQWIFQLDDEGGCAYLDGGTIQPKVSANRIEWNGMPRGTIHFHAIGWVKRYSNEVEK